MPDPPADTLVLDASAAVEALLGTTTGRAVRNRLRSTQLHAPAHLDAEVLSALGRLHRAGDIPATTVTAALTELAAAPITRHPLPHLLTSAWQMRDRLRLVDALYITLSEHLGVQLLTTDARLARSSELTELIAAAS
ncbi:MAG: type II toxin-antitoxin system VapC family toxin [Solirubrobacteraceae bacterium]